MKQEKLYEVWNDTVSRRDLGIASIIGIAITVGAYIAAEDFFARTGMDAGVYRGYALMVGIVFCILSGVVNSIIFRPKREIQEEIDVEDVVDALQRLNVDVNQEIEEVRKCEPDAVEDMLKSGLDALVELSKGGTKHA